MSDGFEPTWFCNSCGEPNKHEWVKCHNCEGAIRYLPLYAEKQCDNCGYWRGQHVGCSANDAEMHCPENSTTFAPA